ncbi:hypothetical protein [Streptomyces caelestis]|uniref:hypothetical protein n=1 Tax=Streptomyces caelestis TaxID=36816 RepID=UPI00364A26E6
MELVRGLADPADREDTTPYMAPELALRLGATNPFALGPGTVVRGRGVVALTALAAEQGAPGTGAYRIRTGRPNVAEG